MTVAAERVSSRWGPPVAVARVGADLAILAAILCAACLALVPNLDRYTVSFPEGIRAEQLLLMAAGYRPCVEIFCNQGPLLFYALYPTFVLFGQTLEAVRSGVVLFALVGIAGTFWVGHLIAGRVGGAAAAALVALSPTYVKFSRLALAEVPAMAPAVIAVGAALMFYRTGRDRWLVGAALLVATSLLLKPVTLAICVPVGLIVLLRQDGRLRNLAVLTAISGVAIAIPTLLIGFSEILEQVVAFRLRSRAVEGRGMGWNLARIVEELAHDRAGLFAFAIAGAAVVAARLRALALPLVAWPLAAFGLLLIHTPLHGKHIVTLIPPAALLAGAGLGLVLRDRAAGGPGRGARRASLAALVAGGATLYLVTLPAIVARDVQLVTDPEPLENDPAAYWYGEVISTLRATTGQRDVIVTDHPYLTFQARRLVPPPLVESSVTRILASSLTVDEAIEEAERYGTDGVLLWADKLATLRGFKSWVDRAYVPVRVYAADEEAMPTLYLRADLVGGAHAVLGALTPRRIDAAFDGGLRLVAAGLDDLVVRAGDSTAVNLSWEADSRPVSDFRVVVQLREDDRVIWKSDEIAVGGLGPGTGSWAAGRRISHSTLITLPRGTSPGEYAVTVRLHDPRSRRPIGPLAPTVEASPADPKGVTVGTLTVGSRD